MRTRGTEGEDALVHGLLSGLAVFRWLAWGWLVAILAVSGRELGQGRPWVAYVLAAAALAVSVVATVLLRTRPAALLAGPFVVTEVAIGVLLAAGDGIAYGGVGHPQTLASVWPLAGILTAGVAAGARGGLPAGAAVGAGALAGDVLEPGVAWGGRADVVAAVSAVVLYALAGGTAGIVTTRLRDAERRIGLAQAREEVARTLHDGVLQTLAVVQRRSSDPEVAGLARAQERELRELLFGAPSSFGGGGDVGARLRAAAARTESLFGGTVRVVLAPDLPDIAPSPADALVGAVAEALTNAAKHGRARTTTVYAEPEGGAVVCSVSDDGAGFDPAEIPEGTGLRRSIRGRVSEAGGRVEVEGRPGRGAEVRLWIPTV